MNCSHGNYAVLMENRKIHINILGLRQQDIAMRFALSKGDMKEKFDNLFTHRRRDGAPAIAGCLASPDCTLVKTPDIRIHGVLFL